uniref:SDR family NAD(P)-dependent oxidoreductase n=1 Tax=Polynucleobacter sp. TaxID=2029855 RepID=UPI0040478F61
MKNPKIALVTGAAKRVGRAIAIGLAKDGWDVAIHYGNSKDAAEQTVKDILATGRRGVALQADLSDESQASQLIGRCCDALGLPSCLVNNASLFQYDVASSFSYASLDRHMLTKVAAPLILSRDLYRQHANLRTADS